MKDGSKIIHEGSHVDHHMVTKAKTMPIYETSVFVYDNLEQVDDYLGGNKDNYMYTRLENPNQRNLEQAISSIEGAEDTVVVSSGMAAINTALMALLSSGDHILVNEEAYGGTISLINQELSRFGIEVTYVSMKDMTHLEKAIKDETKLILTESVTNPLLSVVDVKEIGALAKKYELYLVVDNTFMTPILYKPIEDGADLVLHSLTKYMNGHSDVTAGAISGELTLIDTCRRVYRSTGASINPLEAWLVARGLKTLSLRMKAHSANAMSISQFLENHKKVKKVFYPGLKNHQGHHLASTMFTEGFSGMMSFELDTDLDGVNEFIKGLNMVTFAPSLAGIATTISHPAKTSHRGLSEEKRNELGIFDGTIRLSIGIEDVEDIREDLSNALDKIK